MSTVESDAVRAHLHAQWAAVASSWGEHAEYADARGAPVAEKMLELSAPQPGERVLELACGTGGLGCAAAARVAPGGEVVVSDVAAEMIRLAAARAAALELRNVSTCVLDVEEIDQRDNSHDVVLCREGLMFAVDPARAVREMWRILRPDGRVAIAVWGPRERNPWLAIVLDAVSAQLGVPIPPPGIPGPFSLEDRDALTGLLTDAKFVDVDVSEVAVPLRAQSFDEWWTRTSSLAGPLSNLLASLPVDVAGELRERVRDAATRYETPSGLEFPGVSLLAAGRRS
ncbi:MAG: methylase involved in ubiquinone/menaquinone biosynthesis [Actinomycetia bacterium]|nr:methylase involved in ubiquinone/menaquinone biosynthesis [Actinomycetes bacterium]